MRLPLCVVVGTSWQIVHAAIALNRDTRFANSEIDGVAPDFVLTHDVNAFGAQLA
ncbi:MAG TPA: hypothetical protein VG841_09645 [Caulobacterales bacterium]|nr:hypothetical protein [Caulobacterales bacterium]